jgi:hypothetical protein
MTAVALTLDLPSAAGTLDAYTLTGASVYRPPAGPARSRTAYAAAHVVAAAPDRIDWERTLAYRRHLWSYGLGVAEAMDTAQRGMGLTWEDARELMLRSLAEARQTGGVIVCGAATDQLGEPLRRPLVDIIGAYQEQCALIEDAGGRVVVMASRHLVASARTRMDYVDVYGEVLSRLRRPAIIHWLGDMFDPQLAGYWGARDLDQATECCLEVIAASRAKVDGVKLSLLDAGREVALRRRLPEGVRMYTGDDINYPELIAGDGDRYSHALLGILDAIAPAAATALHALDEGNLRGYHAVLAPTVALSRHIFEAPTVAYKAGIVFLAWLNGHQPEFRLVGGLEGARSPAHYSQLFKLADQARLLADPELAVARMRGYLATQKVV